MHSFAETVEIRRFRRVPTGPGQESCRAKSPTRAAADRFKHPKRYIAVDALPRNAMSKVQKAALRVEHTDLFTS